MLISRISVGGALITALSISWAAPAEAVRVEISAFAGNNAVSDASVCFAPHSPHVLRAETLLLGEVRCLPTKYVLDLPGGSWRYWLEAKDQVSQPHDYYLRPNPDRRVFKKIRMAMHPAGRITIGHNPHDGYRTGDRVILWFTSGSSPATVPLDSTRGFALVRSQDPFVPIVLTRGKIRTVGDPITLREHATEELVVRNTLRTGAVIVPITVTQPLQEAGQNRPPVLTLTTPSGLKLKAKVFNLGTGACAVFNGVPRGAFEITSSDAFWEPIRMHGSASGALTELPTVDIRPIPRVFTPGTSK